MKIKLILAILLLFSAVARADTIVNATVAITPLDNPFSPWGGIGVSYNEGTTDFNAAVFDVGGRDPFTYSRAYNTLTFIPGTYDWLGFETLTISSIGRRVNFLFEIFSFPFVGYDGQTYPGQILTFDWRLPQNAQPLLGDGINTARFYFDDVALRIGTRPFELPTQNAAALVQSGPVATPEPKTLSLLLIGLWLVVAWRLWT